MVPGIPHVAHAPSYDWSGTGIVMRDFDPIPPMFVLASDKKRRNAHSSPMDWFKTQTWSFAAFATIMNRH